MKRIYSVRKSNLDNIKNKIISNREWEKMPYFIETEIFSSMTDEGRDKYAIRYADYFIKRKFGKILKEFTSKSSGEVRYLIEEFDLK